MIPSNSSLSATFRHTVHAERGHRIEHATPTRSQVMEWKGYLTGLAHAMRCTASFRSANPADGLWHVTFRGNPEYLKLIDGQINVYKMKDRAPDGSTVLGFDRVPPHNKGG